MAPSASFDVLGTCFHFTPVITYINDTILAHYPNVLSVPNTPQNTALDTNNHITASALFHSWFYAAQRDFTYLSLTDTYTPILQVFKSTFRRAAHIIGLPDVANTITDADIDGLMKCLRQLPARPGLGECFELLRENGVDVLAVTNGGHEGTLGYFRGADVEISGEDVLSCDEIERDGHTVAGGGSDGGGGGGGSSKTGVAKPDARVYERVNQVLDRRYGESQSSSRGRDRWFVAAHSWDLIAARKAGFRTAWVSHEEGDACSDSLFGHFDVYAEDLEGCARKILEVMKVEQ